MSSPCATSAWPILLAAATLLTGCADALTVHSVVLPDDPAPDVPSLVGRWQNTQSGIGGVLTVEGDPEARGQCREGSGHFRSGADDARATRVCFVELDGYLIAEVESAPPIEGFYRQYLVRIEEDRLEVCGAMPVWMMLAGLAKEHPVGYSLDTLQYTTREEAYYLLMVLISKSEELREFLKTALPELSMACDTHTSSEIDWNTFERVPDEEPTEDGEAPGE
jgi:hypothetical protein